MKKETPHWLEPGIGKYFYDVVNVRGHEPYYVYIWIDEATDEVIYVGSGSGYRLSALTPRSPEFTERLKKSKCVPRIIECGMDRGAAFVIEGRYIKEFLRLGAPLVNKACTKDSEAYNPNANVKEWTINGETKSAKAWCEQYGVPYQRTAWRIKSFGLTPFQALTFPLVPRDWGRKRDCCIGYFKSIGLLPEDWKPEVTPSH